MRGQSPIQLFLTSLAPIYAGIDADRSVNYQFAAADALVAGDA